jgi:hypothetical protein
MPPISGRGWEARGNHKQREDNKMKAEVVITLNVPKSFAGFGVWPKEQCLDDYIHHWLEEGYFVHDYIVELPDGIQYKGYEINYPKEWKGMK